MLQGKFVPRNRHFGKHTEIPGLWGKCHQLLQNPGECRLLCINDCGSGRDEADLELMWAEIRNDFEKLLPEKSGFERQLNLHDLLKEKNCRVKEKKRSSANLDV